MRHVTSNRSPTDAEAVDTHTDPRAGMSPPRTLSGTHQKEWETWARREERTRASILLTVTEPISLELESKHSARSMWAWLEIHYKHNTPERQG